MIKNMLKISEEISKIYQVLAHLEYNNQKNTEYYFAVLENLKEKIYFEDTLYKKLTSEEIHEIIPKISTLKKDIFLARVLEKLVIKLESEVTDVEAKIKIACENDARTIASIFYDKIINDMHGKFKEELIKQKYINYFVNPDVEANLISDNFNEYKGYTKSYLISSLYKIPYETSKYLIDNNYIEILIPLINQLLNIEDKEYINDSSIILSVTLQSAIRAIISLMNDTMLFPVKIKIMDDLEQEENGISKNTLLSILNERDKDREKIKIISFYQIDKMQ